MFDIFGSVKDIAKLDSVCIDNNTFRLHYKATFIILIISSLLVTSRQYIGDPIDCIVEEIPNNVMDTYCWIHSTFSIPSRLIGVQGENIAHSGVSPISDLDEGETVQYHRYYQWVCFTLFFQALLCYIPRYMWKTWEGGKLKFLARDMNVPLMDPDDKEKQLDLIVNYLSMNRFNHKYYAIKFTVCEVINFVNIVGQILLMDFFLDGQFSTYGSDVIHSTKYNGIIRSDYDPSIHGSSERTWDDAMARVFPKMTKCTFHKFGPSGTVEKFDGLCVLPLNIINEKIYVFLWFWFILVSFVTAVQLVLRATTILLPAMRLTSLQGRAKLSRPAQVKTLCARLHYGDWFILYQLSKSIDPLIYRDLLDRIHRRLFGSSKSKHAPGMKGGNTTAT